jgi:hypothetical protein
MNLTTYEVSFEPVSHSARPGRCINHFSFPSRQVMVVSNAKLFASTHFKVILIITIASLDVTTRAYSVLSNKKFITC